MLYVQKYLEFHLFINRSKNKPYWSENEQIKKSSSNSARLNKMQISIMFVEIGMKLTVKVLNREIKSQEIQKVKH